MEVNWSLQAYTDTAANLNARATPILEGQLAIETDTITTTPKFKIGDGVSLYSALPYFYGGALSAQNLSNVLSVGNTTGGLNLVVTNDDIIQIGTTANRYIGFSTATVTGGLEIVNLNSNDHIILQDSGGIHIDTSKVILEQLTASRILSLNANKEIVNETGTGFLKLTAGVISYDNSSYQPLDSDLTSWAGVTRASGFDTFVATPSSANLAALVTGETGSGALVFGTSPTFTTDITTPKINGVSGNILLTNAAQTSGAITNFTFTNSVNTGQTASTEISNFKVNGASKTWANGGAATTIPTQRWNHFTANTAATSGGGSLAITKSYGLYVEQATANSNVTITYNNALGTSGNFESDGRISIISGSAQPNGLDGMHLYFASSVAHIQAINSGVSARELRLSGFPVSIYSSNSGAIVANFAQQQITFSPQAYTTGALGNFVFSVPNNTGQAASTEIPNFRVLGASKTWANGGAATTIATQRWNWFTANTASTSGGGSLTITNSYGIYAEAATASGVTITNNYAAGFGGNINIIGTPYVSGVAGVDGTFTTADAKTVTVTKGIITSIV